MPSRCNKKQFKNDINTLIRKVKLKAHYNHTVKTFKQAFKNDLPKEEENMR